MALKPTITGARFDKDRYKPGEKMSVTLDIDVVEVPTTLVGMSAPNGAQTQRIVDEFPGLAYFSDYGKDIDRDGLTDLTAPATGKLADVPLTAVAHMSWKGTVAQLGAWMSVADPRRQYVINWYREPMDRVNPEAYRAAGTVVASTIDSHRDKAMILGNGPILTRYWLDERNGDPAVWAYPGATMPGIDCYMNRPDDSAYWGGDKMFGVALDKMRNAFPGATFTIPEYGIVRLTRDTTGSGRAEALLSHWEWLQEQPDVAAWAYWNNTVTIDGKLIDYRLPTGSLESAAWRLIQAAQ